MSAESEVTEGTAEQPDIVDLPSGEALSWEAAQAVMAAEETRLIVLGGAVASGKTTILTSLYELFLEAPVVGTRFNASQTLLGFEHRCHEGRTASGRSQAATSRTPAGDGFRFLHLRLESGGGRRRNLLLSDVAGELFRAASNTLDGSRHLEFLRVAHALLLVLDGEKVGRPELRHAAYAEVRMMLKSLTSAGMLRSGTPVVLVLSKVDVLVDKHGTVPAVPGLGELQAVLRDVASKAGLGYSFVPVAARPTSAVVPFAHGVPALLGSWVDSPKAVTDSHRIAGFQSPPSGRRWSLLPVAWAEDRERGTSNELDLL